jgi:5-methylcytosine-specific restriction protein A
MRPKLQTLKPRVTAMATTLRAAPMETPRIRGRALQVRNRRLLWKAPLCVECEKQGVWRAVQEWDHVVPLWAGGADDESNLQGLCLEHHREKSNKEVKARASS